MYQNTKNEELTSEQLITKLKQELKNSHENNEKLRRDIQGKDERLHKINLERKKILTEFYAENCERTNEWLQTNAPDYVIQCLHDFTEAMHSLGKRAVRAEVALIGGRTLDLFKKCGIVED